MKKNNILFNIIIAISFLIISYLITQKAFQNDTFYTIKVGESILKKGIDMKDHFSFIPNLTYVYPHWLYDTFIYLLYSIGGFKLIYLSTVILGFTLLITTYHLSIKLGNNKYISYLVIMLFSFLLNGYFTARAQMFSYLFFIIIIYSIEMLRKSNKKRYYLYLFLSMLFIANMHAAVWLFGLILFLPYIVQDIIYLIVKKFNLKFHKSFNITIEKSNLKITLIALLFCIITGFLTPNFLVPFTYYINTIKGISMSIISEHKPITIDSSPFVYLLVLLTISFILNKKIKIRLTDLFLITGLFILAFSSTRGIALLLILSIFVYSRMLSMIDFSSIECFLWNKYFISILISIFVIAFFVFYNSYSKKEYINKKKYPVDASNYIIQNLDYKNIRLFNQNPLLIFINGARDIILFGQRPSGLTLLSMFLIGAGMLLLGSIVFKKKQDKFIYYA